MDASPGYSRTQIILHWLVAILILVTYVSGDDMGQVLRERVQSGATGIEDNTNHVWLGGAVFVLVLIRLIVRLRHGAPSHAPGNPAWLDLAATLGHRLLYALMLIVPALGAAAWYGGVEAAGDLHETLANVFMIIILGHGLAAIGHEIFRSDGTLQRMFVPRQ
ncbi:MAG: cytochrome b [Pseudomonadota bacterium]